MTLEQAKRVFMLSEYTDNQGNLTRYMWPGGYPLHYYFTDGILCATCANGWRDDVIGVDVNWEDPDMICYHCNEQIESAYTD